MRSIFRCCLSPSPLSSSSMVYSVTLEDSHSDNLSLATNDIIETTHYGSSATGDDNAEQLPEHMPEACTEPCLQTGSLHSAIPGRAISISLPTRITDSFHLLNNSRDRGVNDLNVEENERWKENKTKSVQISDLGLRKCKLNLKFIKIKFTFTRQIYQF